jgi:hypothetical protein
VPQNQQDENAAHPKRAWVKPVMRRFVAGSAEFTGGPGNDGIGFS